MIKKIETFMKQLQAEYGEDETKAVIIMASNSSDGGPSPKLDMVGGFGLERNLGYLFSHTIETEFGTDLIGFMQAYDEAKRKREEDEEPCNCLLCQIERATEKEGIHFIPKDQIMPMGKRPSIFDGILGDAEKRIAEAARQSDLERFKGLSIADQRAEIKDKLKDLLDSLRKL